MKFNMLLRDAGLDPKQVSVILHTTQLQPWRRLLPRVVGERPDLFRAYRSNDAGNGGVSGVPSRRNPRNFRFSILQRLDPDLGGGDVVAIEANWKQRLDTISHGLNRN